MPLQMSLCSSVSVKSHLLQEKHKFLLQRAEGLPRLRRHCAALRHAPGLVSRSDKGKINNKLTTKCSHSSFNLTTKLWNNVDKATSDGSKLQQSCATSSSNELYYEDSTSSYGTLAKKLTAVWKFLRPFALIGTTVSLTSVSFLPLQSLSDLTPQYFFAFFKALVPFLLMSIYVATVNQLFDMEIDKVNKPYLPLASGELSVATGTVITILSPLLSLAIAIGLKSPPLVVGLGGWFLLGTAYSVNLPFLRWKTTTFLAGLCAVIPFAFFHTFPFYMHMQQHVLGRALLFNRPILFLSAFMCLFFTATSILKDIPDEEGDKKFGIQSLSSRIGKEKVLSISVYILLLAYGGALVAGASASSLLGRVVSVIGHSVLSLVLCKRAQTTDLSNPDSTYSFYMFVWKLFSVECLLVQFLR